MIVATSCFTVDTTALLLESISFGTATAAIIPNTAITKINSIREKAFLKFILLNLNPFQSIKSPTKPKAITLIIPTL